HPHSASLLPSWFPLENSLFAPAGKFLPEFIGFSGCFGQTKKAPVRRLSWVFPVFFPVRRESALSGQSGFTTRIYSSRSWFGRNLRRRRAHHQIFGALIHQERHTSADYLPRT